MKRPLTIKEASKELNITQSQLRYAINKRGSTIKTELIEVGITGEKVTGLSYEEVEKLKKKLEKK